MSPSGHRAFLVTPHGTGAIAVIRLVGPDPQELMHHVWVPNGSGTAAKDKLRYGRLLDGDELLDDVLLSVEAVSGQERAVEISCHGGLHIVRRILGLLERRGASIGADESEKLQTWPATTRIEAEAIEALVRVKTQRGARYAAYVRRALPAALKEILFDDGPEREEAAGRLRGLINGFDPATALLRGVTLCLVGPPNSGKSTLLNALVGRQAVVTSPIAGTTRDWVAETVEFGGLAVEIVDTAGRRDTSCELERQAIEVGNFPLERSDLVFVVLDQSAPIPPEVFGWARLSQGEIWVVANKSDLGRCWTDGDLREIQRNAGSAPIFVSASTGEGCELLKQRVLEHFGLLDERGPALAFFSQRQQSLAMEALAGKTPFRELYLSLTTLDLAEGAGKGL